MDERKLERILDRVDRDRRAVLKKLIMGAAFSIPIIASFSVGELHADGLGSGPTTTTSMKTLTSTSTTTTTKTSSTTTTSTTTKTSTTTTTTTTTP